MSKIILTLCGTTVLGESEESGTLNDVLPRIRSRAWELFEGREVPEALDEYSDETRVLQAVEWYEGDQCVLLCADDDVAEICAREIGGIVQSRLGVRATVFRLAGFRWEEGLFPESIVMLFEVLDRGIEKVRGLCPVDANVLLNVSVGHFAMVMLLGVYASARSIALLGVSGKDGDPYIMPRIPIGEGNSIGVTTAEGSPGRALPHGEEQEHLRKQVDQLYEDLETRQNEASELRSELKEKKAIEVVLSVAHETLNQQVTMLQVKNDTLQGQLQQQAARAAEIEEKFRRYVEILPRRIDISKFKRLKVLWTGQLDIPVPPMQVVDPPKS